MQAPARPIRSLVLVAFFVAGGAVSSTAARGQPAPADPWPEGEPVPVRALEDARWYRGGLGWIVVPETGFAARSAEEMLAADRAWERHFGRPAPEGAVIDIAYRDHSEAIEEAGADWVLAYPFERVAEMSRETETGEGASNPAESQAAAVRSQIESSLEAKGVEKSDAEIDAIVKRMLSNLEDGGGGRQTPGSRTVLRHEIGHALFEAAWSFPDREEDRYGTGAPDWLDETAAVLMEGRELTTTRRKVFRRAVEAGETIPLSEFLAMDHPLYGSESFRAMRDSAARNGAVVLSGDEIDVELGRAKYFYSQARALADFLLERSGEPALFAEIARALRSGSGMPTWLRRHGPDHGLPASVPTLEEAFLAWARSAPYAQDG